MVKEIVYKNVWTKLHLGGLRGNTVFKGIWRALRVGLFTGAIFFAQKVIPTLDFIPVEWIPVIATGLEKIIRETFPVTDF